MITGDNTLTACQVANSLNITTKKELILNDTKNGIIFIMIIFLYKMT